MLQNVAQYWEVIMSKAVIKFATKCCNKILHQLMPMDFNLRHRVVRSMPSISATFDLFHLF